MSLSWCFLTLGSNMTCSKINELYYFSKQKYIKIKLSHSKFLIFIHYSYIKIYKHKMTNFAYKYQVSMLEIII